MSFQYGALRDFSWMRNELSSTMGPMNEVGRPAALLLFSLSLLR